LTKLLIHNPEEVIDLQQIKEELERHAQERVKLGDDDIKEVLFDSLLNNGLIVLKARIAFVWFLGRISKNFWRMFSSMFS